MRVCFVVPRVYVYFNDKIKNNAGGAERQIYYLANALSVNNKFDVHCCVADFGQKPIEKINNITLWRSFKPTENKLIGFIKLFKALKKINADKYIFRSADVGTAVTLLMVRFLLKKKTVYMVASNSETSFSELKKMSGLFTAILMPLAYKFANVLTIQTETQKELFKQNRKIEINNIIPNIIAENNIEGVNNENRAHILWVGRLDKVKQPYYYSELAKRFPDQNFVMIAPIIKEDKKFGLEFIESIRRIKNLKHIEYVSPDKIKEYYKKAKIYVITSYTEGFSNTMAEAMSYSCPVLSLKVNPDNIFEKYEIGICANNKQENFYKSFEKSLNNEGLRKQFALNGLDYLKKYHNSKMVLQKFIDKALLR